MVILFYHILKTSTNKTIHIPINKEGKGELEKYKLWLTIQDVFSMGNVLRKYSNKTKRQHEFLTNHETYFLFKNGIF